MDGNIVKQGIAALDNVPKTRHILSVRNDGLSSEPAMTKPAELLAPEWSNVPRMPWIVRFPDGRAFRRFHTSEDAYAWLRRNGYMQ